ncbi:MAG: hypothetical protein R3220_10070 [Balneolaceae bacterium]|nr:hypothetical protein [Balneolaceae bacterium]
MVKSKLLTLFLGVAVMAGTVSCGPSLVIQNVDYAQPLESVLTPDSENMVHDDRYAVDFSIAPILEEEGRSSVSEIRLIRNSAGYYFLTANGFNNVYVLFPAEGELELENKIEFEAGLNEPAFNQRDEYIELVDLASGETYRLDHEGIQEDEDSE